MPQLDNIIEAPKEEAKVSELDVLKELFSIKDVETKTELLPMEVVLINQKRAIAKMLGWNRLNEVLLDFMLLKISSGRKGRAEFVDGFKSDREQKLGNNSSGILQNMKDKFNF